ncbi:substrate-binding periplasmic protein [Pseudoduganella sp. RAF19]
MNALRTILLAMLAAGSVHAEPLIVLVDTSTEMPLADFRRGQLVRGITKDLAEALAQKMGRKLELMVLPRKRIAMALDSGQGDMLCLYLPEWLPGRYQWTQPFFPQAELLLTALSAPPTHSLEELAGRRVGTVLGYRYPEFEHVLGAGFLRDDAPTNLINLRKLAAGRVQYAATIKSHYDYQLKLGEQIRTHPPLFIKQYLTRCALSHKGHVSLTEADAAITQLLQEGVINKIITNYQ